MRRIIHSFGREGFNGIHLVVRDASQFSAGFRSVDADIVCHCAHPLRIVATVKIVATSDLHGFIPPIDDLPGGDLLVIAGDIMPVSDHSYGAQNRFRNEFSAWLAKVEPHYQYGIIGVAGNHDFLFETNSAEKTWLGQYFYPDAGRGYAKTMNWRYLEDEMITLPNGMTVYGTPYVPNLRNWAFYSPESDARDRWDRIDSADIVVSHGPPFGYADYVSRGGNVGSVAFLDAMKRISPQVVICGHIHEGYGVDWWAPEDEPPIYKTGIYNVSYVDEAYKPGNEIMVIVVDEEGE